MPCLFLCLLFFFSFGERWLSIAELSREIRTQEAVLAAVETEQRELEAEREKLRDMDYVTMLAREKLCYIFPGETLCLSAKIDDDVLLSSCDEILIED